MPIQLRDRYEVRVRKSGPPLAESDLDELERSLDLRLPQGYRTLLLERNGGVPTPGCFLMRGFSPKIRLLYQCGSNDPATDLRLVRERLRADWGLPEFDLPIGEIDSDCFLMVRCSAAEAGELRYWLDAKEGFREKDPEFTNVHPVYFRVEELLSKLGPADRREDRDGLFVRLYRSASDPANGPKLVRELVDAGYDLNFLLDGYRHPIFAAMDGDAFGVAADLASAGVSRDHRDPSNGGTTVVERLNEALAFWTRAGSEGASEAIRGMSDRRIAAIRAALNVYAIK